MVLLDFDPGGPAFLAFQLICAVAIIVNLPPFLGYAKPFKKLFLYSIPLLLYITFVVYETVAEHYFYWRTHGDFLYTTLGITFLNLLIIIARRKLRGK